MEIVVYDYNNNVISNATVAFRSLEKTDLTIHFNYMINPVDHTKPTT